MKVFLTMLAVAAALAASATWGQAPPDFLKQGQEIYDNNCADCHRTNGEGLPVKFPALKGNAFVLGDPQPVLDTVVNGRIGKMGQMPAWKDHLGDSQIAAALSYIRNAWGNKADPVTPAQVAGQRKK